MTKQKSPHTQSEQNTVPEQTDLETAQSDLENEAEERTYEHMEGAETGTNPSPRRVPRSSQQYNTQPETVAHEGSVKTRTPKRPAQGITDRPDEEAERQRKVVNGRPDAQAGVNHSK
jgi:hypothetical protein